MDSDGKPVAGAVVAVVGRGWDFAAKEYQVLRKATTDEEGRFRLSVPRHASGETFVLVGKPGYGPVQGALASDIGRHELRLTLPQERALRGRLLDLQGQPAAGVRVWVMRIGTRDDPGLWDPPAGMPLWPKPVTSDAQGRFTITGLPRNTEVVLEARGGSLAGHTLPVPADNADKERTWTLSPGRLLEGKVVWADTGKPAANVRATLLGITDHTDDTGRFKLVGLPAVAVTFKVTMPPLLISPPPGEPYLPVRQEVTLPRAVLKHTVEVKLPRGVLVRGKVTEAESGRPVAGAAVQFVPRETDNPNLRPDVLTGYHNVVASGPDGSFQIVVLPGPGHLLVNGPGGDFIHQEVGSRVLAEDKPGGSRINADGLVKLDLPAGSGPREVNVSLRQGVTVRGRLLGPGGKPVSRTLMVCGLLRTALPSLSHVEVPGGLFALHGCDPAREYPVLFLDTDNGWGAAVTLAGKQAGEDVAVRLAPCGKAVARFVGADGKPLKRESVWKGTMFRLVVTPGPFYGAARKGELEAGEEFAENLLGRKERVARKTLRTDAEGRVSYAGLIPGATYRLTVLDPEAGEVLKKEFRAEAGKTLDLGDVRLPSR
jgi:hypothetical protein